MKILCLGDSNTWGFDPRGFGGGRYEHPWPEILQELTGCETANLGMNGRELPASERSAAILMRMIRAERNVAGATGQTDPGILIILLGTNDLLNINYDILGEVGRRLERLLFTVKTELPELRVLLMTPPQCPELDLWDPGMYDKAIPLYREMAKRYPVELIELAGWELPLSFDGVHLAEEGHRQLAEKLAGTMRALGLIPEPGENGADVKVC